MVVLYLFGLASCSVEKNTSLSRNYHDLTSHYNIYFNGKESYKRGMAKAHTSVKNDYTRILPIFLYEEESVHSAVNSDMKRAIDKATKVITYHSITAKPKVKAGDQSAKDKAFYEKNEYNKWVDDSYMLMGRAYMYQGEFFLAVETFKHVLVTFPADEIRFLAMTWLAQAYIMIGEMREAERILISLSDENELPDEYMEDFLTTRAQFEFKQDSYATAAQYLENALAQKGVTTVPATLILSITDHALQAMNILSQQPKTFGGVETVVVVGANKPNNQLYKALKGKGIELHIVGDAVAPRTLDRAIYDGHRIGRLL